MIPHVWFECRPALLVLDASQDQTAHQPDALGISVVDRVWRQMSDADRHRFHKFTCEGDRSVRTVDVIYEMRAAINKEGVE